MPAQALPAAADFTGASVTEGQFKTALTSFLAFVSELQTKASDVASAGTTAIGAAAGIYVVITGSTTITAFDNPTAATNVTRIVKFAGALTLTHNGTSLILPTGANIATAAGDTAIFVHEGSGNWRCISYQYIGREQFTCNTSPVNIKFVGTAPNDTTDEFLKCEDSSTPRAIIKSNGGLYNYSANNSNLSDERTKNIVGPVASFWEKWKALGFVEFAYKDQADQSDTSIGVIAQQVETVAPELVDNSGFGKTPADGIPLKSIFETDLYMAMGKTLQEAIGRIEELEARVVELEG